MATLPYIKINGQKYELDPDPQVEPAAEIPQKYLQPADEADFWQTWEMRSFQGGERRSRILTKDQTEEMTYDDGEHVDISTWGELKLQPALSRSGGFYAMSSTLPMAVSNNGQTVVVGHSVHAGHYLSTYGGSAWGLRDTPSAAAVTDIITGIANNMYAIQGSRIIESTNNGTDWTNSTKGRSASGTAQSGTTTTIVLAASGSSTVDDYYNGMTLLTTGGTGSGQVLTITNYTGSNKTAEFATATSPGADTTYEIFTAATPRDMVGLAFCANELYALTPTYLKYYDGSVWQTAATWGGDYCCTYNEQVYFTDEGIVYRYNGTAAYEADRLPIGFAISGLYPYGGVLFIPGYWNVQGGKKGSCFYIMEGRRAHLYNVGSTDGSSDYTITSVAGSDDEVWIANQKRGGVDRFDMSKTGGVSSGPAWGSTGIIPFKGVAYSDGRVFVARYTAADETGTVQDTGNDNTHIHLGTGASTTNDYYVGMVVSITAGGAAAGKAGTVTAYVGSTKIATFGASLAATPVVGDTYYIGSSGVYVSNVAIPTVYEVTGYVTTSEFDWFLPHDYKLFSKIVIEYKALAASQTIKVEYSLDGGTTYTIVGYADIIGSTNKEFKITNARSRSLKLRLTLNGPGTSTPTVTYVRVDAGPLGEATSLFDYNLAFFSALQGRQRRTELKKAYGGREVVQLVDEYGDTHDCVFEYLKFRPQLGDKWTVRVFVRLREV